MQGKTHMFVANISLACLSQKERHILYPRWGGIESGATLSDEFRIMWEPIEAHSKDKQLVHRCWVDSENIKDHGCVTRANDHAQGCISFIQDYMKDELKDYNEEEFLENLGMFMGIASHHIADLCTPVHVGHKINFKNLDFPSLSKFHNKVERDIYRHQNIAPLKLSKPKQVIMSEEYFWNIAKETYNNSFLKLETIYKQKDNQLILEMVADVISKAIIHTTNIWHTILKQTNMTKRKWSMQPLL